MKKSLITLSLFSSIFISTNVLSDELKNGAENFKGLNLGLGLNVLKFNSNYSDSVGPQDNVNYHTVNVTPRFDASYTFDLNNKWLLGLGLSLDLYPIDGDKHSLSQSVWGGGDWKSRTTNHYSVYLTPTYLIDDSLAVFGKLSYQSKNIDNIWTYPDGYNDHVRLNGIGAGLGIKKMINQNIYLQIEGEYVDYSNKSLSNQYGTWIYDSNSSYSGTLSIGYHF